MVELGHRQASGGAKGRPAREAHHRDEPADAGRIAGRRPNDKGIRKLHWCPGVRSRNRNQRCRAPAADARDARRESRPNVSLQRTSRCTFSASHSRGALVMRWALVLLVLITTGASEAYAQSTLAKARAREL